VIQRDAHTQNCPDDPGGFVGAVQVAAVNVVDLGVGFQIACGSLCLAAPNRIQWNRRVTLPPSICIPDRLSVTD